MRVLQFIVVVLFFWKCAFFSPSVERRRKINSDVDRTRPVIYIFSLRFYSKVKKRFHKTEFRQKTRCQADRFDVFSSSTWDCVLCFVNNCLRRRSRLISFSSACFACAHNMLRISKSFLASTLPCRCTGTDSVSFSSESLSISPSFFSTSTTC